MTGRRKAPLWRRGQAWAPVCSHTASPRHTLAGPLRTECQQRRSKDRSGKAPPHRHTHTHTPGNGRGMMGKAERGGRGRFEEATAKRKGEKEKERLNQRGRIQFGGKNFRRKKVKETVNKPHKQTQNAGEKRPQVKGTQRGSDRPRQCGWVALGGSKEALAECWPSPGATVPPPHPPPTPPSLIYNT